VNIVGTYFGESELINGVYIVSLNTSDFKLSKIKQTIVPEALVSQLDKDGWAYTKKNKYGLLGIGMQAYSLEDGSIDMIGMFSKRDMGTRAAFYTAGDILAVHFGKGDPVFTRVPKYRVSAGTTVGDAYYVFPFKNSTIIFYDDSENNLANDINQTPKSSSDYNNNVLVAATIPGDGTVKREIILNEKKEHYLALTDAMRVQSPSTLLVPLSKIFGLGGMSKYFKWATIEIK